MTTPITPGVKSVLLELAERCETAGAEEQANVLWHAFRVCEPEAPDARYDEFAKLLDAGGFIDAAMSLVPEGYTWCFPFAGPPWAARISHIETRRISLPLADECATPALALCAAALRARAA